MKKKTTTTKRDHRTIGSESIPAWLWVLAVALPVALALVALFRTSPGLTPWEIATGGSSLVLAVLAVALTAWFRALDKNLRSAAQWSEVREEIAPRIAAIRRGLYSGIAPDSPFGGGKGTAPAVRTMLSFSTLLLAARNASELHDLLSARD